MSFNNINLYRKSTSVNREVAKGHMLGPLKSNGQTETI